MSMFTLAISCLPWFMDLTFQVPMQYCSLQHWTYSITRHIHNWALFLLWLCLFILSEIFSPLFSSSILGTHQPGEGVHLSVSYFWPFHTVHGVLKARILKWFTIAFSRGPRFVRTLCHNLSWVALLSMARSFIELDKAVVHVINLVNFLWLWFSFCLPSDG